MFLQNTKVFASFLMLCINIWSNMIPKHMWTHSSCFQSLTSLLQQDDEQARQHFQDLRHYNGWCCEEAVTWQRADVSDAEDEGCILDHQHRQADVLQPPVDCRSTHKSNIETRSQITMNKAGNTFILKFLLLDKILFYL